MNRRWLITISLLAHAGLGVGLFAAGVWHIERLDRPKYNLVLGVPLPHGGEPEGGASAAAPVKLEEKKKKKVVKEPVQPQIKTPEIQTAMATASKDGEGEGSGKGSATGDTVGPPGGERCDDPMGCTDGTSGGRGDPAVCGNGAKEDGETCDDGNVAANDGCSASCKVEVKTIFVPPTVLQGLRISGETQIHAPDTVKTQMLRDGREQSSGTLKLCIATDGRISSVSVAVTTKYDAYDAKLVATARDWRYKPYTVNGTPMPVCGMVTFKYTIR